jgi:uncharacterized protein YjbJ (UPF0337 family)
MLAVRDAEVAMRSTSCARVVQEEFPGDGVGRGDKLAAHTAVRPGVDGTALEPLLGGPTGPYTKEIAMNADVFAGKWKQAKGQVKDWWGKLTDDDLTRVEGNRDKLVGIIQERYGYAKERAEQEVDRRFRDAA